MQVFVRRNNNNNNNSQISENRLRLDLNINPLKFIENEKSNLITRIQLILQQPPFIKSPKIIILNQEVFKLYPKSGISFEFYVIDEQNNDKIVDGSLVMKLLFKLLKSNKFLKISAISNSATDSNDLVVFDNILHDDYVYDLRQMKCMNNCSSHGYCDYITYKCVCDRYWMFNLYKFYLPNNFDETYGNNCGKFILLKLI
jgi:hypothetical protein